MVAPALGDVEVTLIGTMPLRTVLHDELDFLFAKLGDRPAEGLE